MADNCSATSALWVYRGTVEFKGRPFTSKMLLTRGYCHGYTGLQPLEPLRGSTSGLMPPPPFVNVLLTSMLSSNSTCDGAYSERSWPCLER